MKDQIEIINTKIIDIEWEGPLKAKEVADEKNRSIDYGVYQYYGDHPVYGLDVLLYIGQASAKTFGKEIRPDKFENWYQKNIQIYLGRICLEKEPVRSSDGAWDKAWGDMIDRAMKLLIHASFPALNCKWIQTPLDADTYKELLILNRGKYRSLLPVVSGYRVIEQA